MSLHRQSISLLRKYISYTSLLTKTTDVRGIKRWAAPTLRELQRRKDKIGEQPPKPRSTYLEWNYDAEIYAFGGRLGEKFDINILKQALTHKSYINEQENQQKQLGITAEINLSDNKELVLKGESILSSYIQKSFHDKYPKVIVQSIHNYLMSEKVLSQVGCDVGLKDIILTSEFPVENLTIANTFKAIIGALEKSSTLENTETFVKDILLSQLHDKDLFDLWEPQNPYEYLKDICKTDIEPRLCNQSAINTILANYQVGIYSNKKLLGTGWGESVQIAKDTAALDVIQKMFKTNNIL